MTRWNFMTGKMASAFCAMAITIAALGSPGGSTAPGEPSGPSPIPDAGVVGVTAGSGSLLVAGTNTPFLPRGLVSVGLLYPTQYASAMCTQKGNEPDSTEGQELEAAVVAMTTETDQQLLGMKQHWRANSVRFQVSQGALTYEHENGLTAYTNMVLSGVEQARAMGLVTIVSMQTEGRSCTPLRADGQLQKLPDQLTEEAWAQIAPSLGHDKGVILEVFNEPNTNTECSTGTSVNWTDWATGCGTGPDEGMVTVGQYLRTLAPENVLLFDGDSNASQFTGFTPPSTTPANSAYTVHPYSYTDGPSGWDSRFGDLQASGSTVVVTEWNESVTCPYAKDPNQVLASELVQTYLPDHNIGLHLFSWDAPGALVNSSDDPVDSNSSCPYFTGATLTYNQFWSEAGEGQPTPDVHVSSITMANGRVDSVTVALGSNGGMNGSPGPEVPSSVELLVQPTRFSIPSMLASMQVSTSAPWTYGSFSLATASGLAQQKIAAPPGSLLIVRVQYQDGSIQQIAYAVR
jgi:hypothetical protein